MNYEVFSNFIIVLIVKSILPNIIIFIFNIKAMKIAKDIDKKIKSVAKAYWLTFALATFLILLSYLFGYSLTDFIDDMLNTAVNFNMNLRLFLDVPIIYFGIWALIIAIIMLYKDAVRYDHNEDIIKKRKIKKEKLDDIKNIPLDYDKNIFICGKNGSGKTVALLNFIENHIKNGEFCIIMDGKGDNGKHSLYEVVSKLCIRENRKLYIINQTVYSETHSYNPFKGCNPTQIKDMLIAMTEWSEEHYKALSSEFFQAVADFMIKADIPISFQSIIKVANNFSSVIETKKDLLDLDDYIYYKTINVRCSEDVIGSISRFSTMANGIGKNLFDDTRNDFNLKQAYKEKAVVLVLLNKLEYTDFARGVGKLVLNDIKNVLGDITKIRGEHEKFLCVYDELSVYFSDMIVDIVNKSRSLGGTNILSTQTIADMDVVNENIRRAVIGNMHGFYLLKQADDKSAETLSNAIGTKKGTEITNKLDYFGKTGDGTLKIVDEFKVHPNDLKELPLEVGYWVDTMEKDFKIYRVKLPYINVDDIEEYEFKDI